MRRSVVVFFILALMLGGISAPAYARTNCYQDTSINKMGDWFATLGKKGMEKKRILARRKYERVAACRREGRA